MHVRSVAGSKNITKPPRLPLLRPQFPCVRWPQRVEQALDGFTRSRVLNGGELDNKFPQFQHDIYYRIARCQSSVMVTGNYPTSTIEAACSAVEPHDFKNQRSHHAIFAIQRLRHAKSEHVDVKRQHGLGQIHNHVLLHPRPEKPRWPRSGLHAVRHRGPGRARRLQGLDALSTTACGFYGQWAL